jgi:hypothetical protein
MTALNLGLTLDQISSNKRLNARLFMNRREEAKKARLQKKGIINGSKNAPQGRPITKRTGSRGSTKMHLKSNILKKPKKAIGKLRKNPKKNDKSKNK